MNTEVEDLLREGMERFTSDLRAPAGLVRRSAARRRRLLALRSLTAATATALTAGAVALVTVVVPGSSRGAGDAVLTADTVKHVTSALSTADPGTIAQMTLTTRIPGYGTPVTAEEWSYGSQWRSVTHDSSGHPLYDEGLSAKSVYTLVSYQTRTWTRRTGLVPPALPARPAPPVLTPPAGTSYPVPLPAPASGCGPAVAALPLLFRFGLPAIRSSASSLPGTVAKSLHTAVSCGTLTVAGHQRVNGVDAIKLTSRAGSLLSETIWVSPGTYLPVRVVVGGGPGGPGIQQTANISWLPTTARNRHQLTVPVPAGFRKTTLPDVVAPILGLVPLRPEIRVPYLAPSGSR